MHIQQSMIPFYLEREGYCPHDPRRFIRERRKSILDIPQCRQFTVQKVKTDIISKYLSRSGVQSPHSVLKFVELLYFSGAHPQRGRWLPKTGINTQVGRENHIVFTEGPGNHLLRAPGICMFLLIQLKWWMEVTTKIVCICPRKEDGENRGQQNPFERHGPVQRLIWAHKYVPELLNLPNWRRIDLIPPDHKRKCLRIKTNPAVQNWWTEWKC